MGEKTKRPTDDEYPEGGDFLRLVRRLADACARHTDDRVLHMGKKAPRTLEQLGTVLSILERVGSCWWGCRGGDHVPEYLVARCCSSAFAALTLAQHGFYDEALSLARNLGELANLMFLFAFDDTKFKTWKHADENARLRSFSPVKVRLTLQNAQIPIPIEQDHYQRLSGVATHASPSGRPQLHNPTGRPSLGGLFQDAGFLVCLNEIAYVVGIIATSTVRLADVSRDRRRMLKREAVALIRSIGGIGIREERDVLEKLRQQPAPSDGDAA